MSVMSLKVCKAISCAKEGTLENPLKHCSRCKQVWYCNRKCQVMDWQAGHNIQCKSVTVGLGSSASSTPAKVAAVAVRLAPPPQKVAAQAWIAMNLHPKVSEKIVEDIAEKYRCVSMLSFKASGLFEIMPLEIDPELLSLAIKNTLIQVLVGRAHTEDPSMLSGYTIPISNIDTSLIGDLWGGVIEPALQSQAEVLFRVCQSQLQDAKKNQYFQEQGTLVVEKACSDLTDHLDHNPDWTGYFQKRFLPQLAEARQRIAKQNQSLNYKDFGMLMGVNKPIYVTLSTPLGADQYVVYNERMLLLFESQGSLAWKYNRWTAQDMTDLGWIGPTSCIMSEQIGLGESVGLPSVSKERQSFSQEERHDILVQPGFGLHASNRERAKRFVTLFPKTDRQFRLLNILPGIMNMQRREMGSSAARSSAFLLQVCKGAQFPNVIADRLDRTVHCLELLDPSNTSTFWMMGPEPGEQPCVYLEHASVLEGLEIIDTEIEPLFLEVVALKKQGAVIPERLKELIGQIRYAFAQATPYLRGSASIAEWVERVLYKLHGMHFTPLPQADCEALTLPKAEFMDLYRSRVELAAQGDGSRGL